MYSAPYASQSAPGTGRLALNMVVAAGIGAGICYLVSRCLRPISDQQQRLLWIGVSGAAGGLLGLGVWSLQRYEAQHWIEGIGYSTKDGTTLGVRFPIHRPSGQIFLPYSIRSKRFSSFMALIASPFYMTFKVARDALAFLAHLGGALIGMSSWGDVGHAFDRLIHDIPYLIGVPLFSALAIFFPYTGQYLVANSVRWANQIDRPETYSPVHEAFCDPEKSAIVRSALYLQVVPVCNQPFEDVYIPYDHLGNPRELDPRYQAAPPTQQLQMLLDNLAGGFREKYGFLATRPPSAVWFSDPESYSPTSGIDDSDANRLDREILISQEQYHPFGED